MYHELSDLFCDLFDAGSLRRFLARGDDGAMLLANLPGTDASLACLADAAVEQLRRRGLIPAVLRRLSNQFPARHGEIDALAKRWHIGIDAEGPGDSSPPTGSLQARRLLGLVLVAAAMVELTIVLTRTLAGPMPGERPDVHGALMAIPVLIDLALGMLLRFSSSRLVGIFAGMWFSFLLLEFIVLGIVYRSALLGALGVLLYVPLLILLVRRRPLGRRLIGLLLLPLGAYFAAGIIITYFAATLASMWIGCIEVVGPAPQIHGTGGYRIALPDDGWCEMDPIRFEQENPPDRVLVHQDTGSTVSIFAIEQPHSHEASIDQRADALLSSLETLGAAVEVLTRDEFDGSGRLLHLRFTSWGVEMESWMGVFSSGPFLYQIHAFTDRRTFRRMQRTLRAITESFTVSTLQ